MLFGYISYLSSIALHTFEMEVKLMNEILIFDKVLMFDGHADQYLNHLSQGGEKNFLTFAKQYIQDGSTIIDVGANIGFVSSVFSSVNPNGKIYALEPGDLNYSFLTKNIAINKLMNVIPFKLAVSNKSGFSYFNENSAWGYLEERVGITKVITLDEFVEEEKLLQVDLIKIDVEGFEDQVFEGMVNTLSRFNPKVIFEFNSFCMLCYGKRNPLEFMKKISENFSTIYRFNKEFGEKDLLLACSLENFAVESLHQNIVFDGSVNDYLVYN
jgi:FkbM family methyltransferase